MTVTQKPDFGGWATKNDLLCSDGRTIRAGAFKHQSGEKVPLVWHHRYDMPDNILGHVMLSDRPGGVYAEAFFNDTDAAETAKKLVKHGDINMLSIFARNLVQQGSNVMHGDIKEVSLVLASANPGAFIEEVSLAHGDETILIEDEAIIYTGEELIHSEDPPVQNQNEQQEEPAQTPESTPPAAEEEEVPPVAPVEEPSTAIETAGEDTELGETMGNQQLEHAEGGRTVQEIYDAMDAEEQEAVQYLVGEAVTQATSAEHSDMSNIDTDTIIHELREGLTTNMNHLFENNGRPAIQERPTLSHDQLRTVIDDSVTKYKSLKESFLAHAEEYGIEDINLLFPDARTDGQGIQWIKRRTEWVANVLDSVRKSPFSRVKSLTMDVTADEARAKGYVKATLKKEEVIKLLKRVTTPKTIYKKQKLDRDDILDITEVDIVAWIKGEMRLMLDEEIAAAILVGDGREPDDEDKIDEDHLRPIAFDVDMYNTTVQLDGTPTPAETIEAILRARKNYKGTGTPTFYTTDDVLTDLILDKDTLGRRFYNTEAELAAALRVKEIVVVEAMERVVDVVGIMVNLVDYQVGADKGGEINMFDDFDLDYNQEKYLIETRISGALIKPKAAVTIVKNKGTVVTPNAPTFVPATGVVTIPAQTGVVYKNEDTQATLSSGAQTAIAAGSTVNIQAYPAANYSFPHNGDVDWSFTRPLA